MSTNAPAPLPADLPLDIRVAVVAARFNAAIVDELLAGCLGRLQALDRTGGSHGHAGERAAEAAVEMICMVRAAKGKGVVA